MIEPLYQIHWTNKETGKSGIGTKQLSQAEAEPLAIELNKDYEDFMHVAMPVGSPPPEPVRPELAAVSMSHAPHFTELTDSSPMPFGVHQDKPMIQVPSDYLDFVSGQAWLEQKWPAVAAYVARSRKAINQDLERME